MLNRYPAWKNLIVIAVAVVGILVALPNLYGEDPAVQVSTEEGQAPDQSAIPDLKATLEGAGIDYESFDVRNDRMLIRFPSTEAQIEAKDRLLADYRNKYTVALNSAPRTPEWLRSMGLEPMNLGLDLKGGVHFLLRVDMDSAVDQSLESYQADLKRNLREDELRYASVERDGEILRVRFREPEVADRAEGLLSREFNELDVGLAGTDDTTVEVRLTRDQRQEIRNSAIDKNIITLRNRVNELGVSEPLVQRQGAEHIVVQLPGIQDTARAKEVLGSTATLEFRLVDESGNAFEAQETGRAPLGSKLYEHRNGRPILLKRDIIVSGDQLIDAAAGFDQKTGGPVVHVTLNAKGADRMLEATRDNIGRQMAIVFIENEMQPVERGGETELVRRRVEEVISAPTIQDALSKRFQITGLNQNEASNLALLLRAGSLAAPVDIVEERTVGPSMGQDNIEQGFAAVLLGFALVIVFMALYYRAFGLVADVALMFNLVLIVAVLSLFQATLTLPGIAGIVLTVGMAVDANVLIFERIREELRNGNTPQASIHSGYEKAFSTIADANVTTLIASIVLFSFGTGPIKGFAVTLSIGILTSMFTAIVGSRAIVNAIVGGRRLTRLSI